MSDPAEPLLAWYDVHRRRLPWRAEPGEAVDPYRVWLSEVMLQQTTVVAVVPYYRMFLARWPTVTALAAAPLEEVLAAWAGLGYYARARNLHRCARLIVDDRGGRFPDTEAALRELPGIGAYTAAAVAAIAFEQPAAAVDGNVERVMARLFAVTDPLPGAKPRLAALARTLVPERRCGDFVQAMIELGATVCTPTRPACLGCPWHPRCAGVRLGLAAGLPRRSERRQRPHRQGVVFWLTDPAGRVLVRRRPPRGLLGGMLEFPGTEWIEGAAPDADAIALAAPAAKIGGPAPAAKIGGPAPAAKIGGPAPAAEIGGPAPAAKIGGPAPAVKIGGSAPAAKIGGLAPAAKIGGLAPAAKIGGPAPAAEIGGFAPAAEIGGLASVASCGGSAPAPAVAGGIAWRLLPGQVRHVFTHFTLALEVRVGCWRPADVGRGSVPVLALEGEAGWWLTVDELGREALPSVMRKVVTHVAESSGADGGRRGQGEGGA